jgi:hypothetical protein
MALIYPLGLTAADFSDGNTATGWQPENFVYGAHISIPSAGTVTQLGVKCFVNTGSADLKFGLYTSAGSLVAQATATGVTGSMAWVNSGAISASVSAGTYYVLISASIDQVSYGFDSAGNGSFATEAYATAMAASETITDQGDTGNLYGVRLDFTAAPTIVRVGTGVTGESDGTGTTTFSAPAKSVTAGNALFAVIKWEQPGVTLSSVADTAGNTWSIIGQTPSTLGEPMAALAVALNISTHAANVVTATFSTTTAGWQRIIVEEFSGLMTASAQDGSYSATDNLTASPWTAPAITTTTPGLIIAGLGSYGTLTSPAGGGSPAFSLGAATSDTAFAYLISGSAQTVTPTITSSSGGGGRGVMARAAFKVAGSGGSSVVPAAMHHLRQQGIS